MILVATLSRKYLSWVTMISAPGSFFSSSSSHSAISLSRWFVGSSRISRSGLVRRAATSASFLRCPPERIPHFAVKSVTPSLVSIRFASVSSSWSVCPDLLLSRHFWRTASITVCSSGNIGCCGKKLITRCEALVIVPLSDSSSPAIIFSSVDFPVPLIPMMPTFSPSSR